jgi:hypothetical protein
MPPGVVELVAVRMRFAGGHVYGLVDADGLDALLNAAVDDPRAGVLLVVERLPGQD